MDLLKQLNEDIKSSLVNVNEDYFENDYGKIELFDEERCGDDFDMYRKVYYFEKYDKYFSICGSYSSYDGYDFGGATFDEVVPKEVTVTQWVKV